MTSTPSTDQPPSAVDQWLDHQSWRRHLAEHLGLNPHQITNLRHHDRTTGWRAVTWTATTRQQPHPLPDAFVAIDRPTLVTDGQHTRVQVDQELYIRPAQWQQILDRIGAEPDPIGPDARQVLDRLRDRGNLPRTAL